MKSALQTYLDGFNRGDAEAITAFYQRAVEVVDRLELDTPIRGSHGRCAAMSFTIHMEREGTP